MKIKINKYNYITAYCEVGDIDNSIELNFVKNLDIENIFDYQYIDNKFIKNPIPKIKPLYMIKPIYNGSDFIEETSIEDCITFYEKKILEISKEIEERKNSGFEGDFKYIELQKELSEYKKLYMKYCHELAISIDKNI